MKEKLIPAKEEHLAIFAKKFERLNKVVKNKKAICNELGILDVNLYQALAGKFSVTTYMRYNDILDEYAREIIGECNDFLKIKKVC